MPRHHPLKTHQWQFGRTWVRDIELSPGSKIAVYRRDRQCQYEYILYRPLCTPMEISHQMVRELAKGQSK